MAPYQYVSRVLFSPCSQHCPLYFASWMYNGHFLNLTNMKSSADLLNYNPSVEWDLVRAPSEVRKRFTDVETSPLGFGQKIGLDYHQIGIIIWDF